MEISEQGLDISRPGCDTSSRVDICRPSEKPAAAIFRLKDMTMQAVDESEASANFCHITLRPIPHESYS